MFSQWPSWLSTAQTAPAAQAIPSQKVLDRKKQAEDYQEVLGGTAVVLLVVAGPWVSAECALVCLYLELIMAKVLSFTGEKEAADYINAHPTRLTLFAKGQVTPLLKDAFKKAQAWVFQPPPADNPPPPPPGLIQRVTKFSR